ncbi:MAG: hypothetical protein QM778_17955 [Myxococcales bacterium]
MGSRLAIAFVLSLALLGAAPGPRSGSAQGEHPPPLVVIVAKGEAVRGLSLSELRSIFEGNSTQYARGRYFIPINQPAGSPLRERFDRIVLGRDPDEAGRFWVDRRIRTGQEPPRTLPTEDLAARVVASLPGAITYVPADLVPPGVATIAIDGKLPGASGYLLSRF